MADSGLRVRTEDQPKEQEQSTLDWLYNTAVSFLPSWSSTPDQSAVAQPQPTTGVCQETGKSVCHCKNKRATMK